MKKSNIKIPLTTTEKQRLKQNKLKIADIPNYAVDELEVMLGVSFERARAIYALVEFQSIPSVGIRFAEDLVSMGYFSIGELKGKEGALLTNEFELLKGYWIDPCVEDQFRLVVYYANTNDASKNWWDFTNEKEKIPQRKWISIYQTHQGLARNFESFLKKVKLEHCYSNFPNHKLYWVLILD